MGGLHLPRNEVWSSMFPHPLLPGWCPSVSSKQMLLTTKRWLIYPLISSSELRQASKQTKQKSNLRGHLKQKNKTSFDLFFNWIPSIICVASLAWTVGMRGAILSSKQGVSQALSQYSWLFTSFSATFLQGLLHVINKRWFKRRYRKYCSYSDIHYSPLSGPNWLTLPRKPQNLLHLSSFPIVWLSQCKVEGNSW